MLREVGPLYVVPKSFQLRPLSSNEAKSNDVLRQENHNDNADKRGPSSSARSCGWKSGHRLRVFCAGVYNVIYRANAKSLDSNSGRALTGEVLRALNRALSDIELERSSRTEVGPGHSRRSWHVRDMSGCARCAIGRSPS